MKTILSVSFIMQSRKLDTKLHIKQATGWISLLDEITIWTDNCCVVDEATFKHHMKLL